MGNLAGNFKRYTIFAGTNSFDEAKQAMVSILKGTFFRNDGFQRKSLEAEFAAVAGCNYAWAFSSGRMGLYSVLKALKFEKDDEVILPAYTCIVVPNAIKYAGLKPVYADIDLPSMNLSVESLKSRLTGKTKVIYIQHNFGLIQDCVEIRQIAKEKGILIIEDCAHVLGVKDSSGRTVGSIGDVALFSTDHSKIINAGYGGLITTNSEFIKNIMDDFYKSVPELPWWLQLKLLFIFAIEAVIYQPSVFFWAKSLRNIMARLRILRAFSNELIVRFEDVPYYPTRLSEGLAGIARMQLKKLPSNLNHRAEVMSVIEERLQKGFASRFPMLRYSFFVKDRALFLKQLPANFEWGLWFTSIFQGRTKEFHEVDYINGSCPNAEWAAKHVFNIFTHSHLSIEVIRGLLDRYAELMKRYMIEPPVKEKK
ncbi:MAG: DegT/DnrJ/EryC1/StrS family aminotransferase [Bdellovibrio sp.]